MSRDELKEGYINTTGAKHNPSDNSIDLHIYETFFKTLELLITKGISIIIEAAFQHKLWKPKLSDFSDKADIRIIICETDPDLAKTRFANRLMNDPGRKTFHGDDLIISSDQKNVSLIESYENVSMDVPILHVGTAHMYNPGIEGMIDFIKQKNNR